MRSGYGRSRHVTDGSLAISKTIHDDSGLIPKTYRSVAGMLLPGGSRCPVANAASDAATSWPCLAARRRGRSRRIGMLMAYAERDWEGQLFVATFVEGLAKLGWVEGRSIRIDVRWVPASNDADSSLRAARELIAFQPDLILSHGTPNPSILHELTRTVPVLFVNASDPIGSASS